MSQRAQRALFATPLAERMEDAAAQTKHCAYDPNGNARTCGCTIETEHDAATGEILSFAQIVERKSNGAFA